MILRLSPEEFFAHRNTQPVIDVRAPVEFRQGHIPGSMNIPLYNDDERAEVGTIYAMAGKGPAILRGIDIALPKVGHYLELLKSLNIGGEILLHCWRGGLRSATMAEVFSRAGFTVGLLDGGYKSYRHYIRQEFERDRKIMILGGFTGSGKTRLLEELELMGEQVVNLEKLASHKGSVFGAIGEGPQPTNEQFENELFDIWRKTDPTKFLWLEHESRMIGRVTLPEPVFSLIEKSPLLLLRIEKSRRIRNLVEDYATSEKQLLADAIRRIAQRIGGELTNTALNALESDDFQIVAEIALRYYDKAYQHAIDRRVGKMIIEIDASDHSSALLCRHLIQLTTNMGE